MIIVIIAITEKRKERNKILIKIRATSKQFTTRYPAPPIRMFKNRSIRIYLYSGFKKRSLNKVFYGGIDCGKYSQKGQDDSKNRLFKPRQFIKLRSPPCCYKYDSNHLEGNA